MAKNSPSRWRIWCWLGLPWLSWWAVHGVMQYFWQIPPMPRVGLPNLMPCPQTEKTIQRSLAERESLGQGCATPSRRPQPVGAFSAAPSAPKEPSAPNVSPTGTPAGAEPPAHARNNRTFANGRVPPTLDTTDRQKNLGIFEMACSANAH